MKAGGHLFVLTTLTLLLLPFVNGQKFSFGSCPRKTTIPGIFIDFELVGKTWREYARTPSLKYSYWRCITYTFQQYVPNFLYGVNAAGVDKITGGAVTFSGWLNVGGPFVPLTVSGNYLAFQFSQKVMGRSSIFYMPFAVSNSYMVLYDCENVPFGKIQTVIILVSSTATTANINAALNSLSGIGYPQHALRNVYKGCTS